MNRVMVSSLCTLFLLLFLNACQKGPMNDTARSDLEKSLFRVGTVQTFHPGESRLVEELVLEKKNRILHLSFEAAIRLSGDMRNHVAHAREGRHQREYVRWVMQQSTTADGRELLEHTSLLENLSSEVWYERKAQETVLISGQMRYRDENGFWRFLGVFE